ncbi:MAG TPA: hypothetical protein ENI99_05405 [Sedimenticola sp.]|nr:hypothetical protein [Sedimenticola sp.]
MPRLGNTNPSSRLAPAITIALILIAAIAIRIPGLFTDLWIDEIWALELLKPVKTFSEIFTAIHFDTNHWLYSLYRFGLQLTLL